MIGRIIFPRVVMAIALLACQAGPSPSSAVLAAARQELEARGQADQRVREGFGTGGQVDSAQAAMMARTDSANTAWLKAYVARWGWPTVRQVGREAVEAAFLIVQHAVHDTAFMRAMLPAIRDSHRRGDLDGESWTPSRIPPEWTGGDGTWGYRRWRSTSGWRTRCCSVDDVS